jgi:hypothetical protein
MRSAWGAVAGPAAFIGAWTVGSVTRAGYDPIQDPISRLAELGAPTRALMTAGFLGFGAGVLAAAPALGRRVGGAAAATALATIGVAATPLNGTVSNPAHGAFAFAGYATLAACPLLAAPTRLNRACGIAAALCLAVTLTPAPTGLFQRLGLTIGDLWLAGYAVTRARSSSKRSRAEG